MAQSYAVGKRLSLFQAQVFQEIGYFKLEVSSAKWLGLQRHDWVLGGAKTSLYKREIGTGEEIHLKEL